MGWLYTTIFHRDQSLLGAGASIVDFFPMGENKKSKTIKPGSGCVVQQQRITPRWMSMTHRENKKKVRQ